MLLVLMVLLLEKIEQGDEQWGSNQDDSFELHLDRLIFLDAIQKYHKKISIHVNFDEIGAFGIPLGATESNPLNSSW